MTKLSIMIYKINLCQEFMEYKFRGMRNDRLMHKAEKEMHQHYINGNYEQAWDEHLWIVALMKDNAYIRERLYYLKKDIKRKFLHD